MACWCEPVSAQGQDRLGATAVQVAVEDDGVRRIVEHLGPAHDEAGPAALPRTGRQKIAAEQGQGLLDLESLEPSPGRTGLAGATVETKRSALLCGVRGVSRTGGVFLPVSR